MKAHDTFYLAHRAHNLLQPLIAEAKQQGIKVTLGVNMSLVEPHGSPLTISVLEVKNGGGLGSIAYQNFFGHETLKQHEEQMEGLVEHVRDSLAIRASLRTLVNA